MHLRSDSAAGIRFLASMRLGRGVKPSARVAGVGKETGFRWLRESFLALRDEGVSVAEAQAALGYFSPRVLIWDEQHALVARDGRHHLAVALGVEDVFWARFADGASLDTARRAAGIGRSTAYRWWRRRFMLLRDQGVSARQTGTQLRVPRERTAAWETERRHAAAVARLGVATAEQLAVRTSARHVDLLVEPRHRTTAELREQRYWELMRQGVTNTAACRILGVNRRTGGLIRARHRHQSATETQQAQWAGRYLSLRERLQIADLLALGCSIRKIAAELGRSPSTVKRELDRHRDDQGRYLPQSADHAAQGQRRRPREHKLVANQPLRLLVQRKLNRCWSPDEISGWLRLNHPENPTMQLCAETIYRALLVPGGRGLQKRYCAKLRTGRRLRRSRYLTRGSQAGAVQNMTMIDQRPAEVETKAQAGDWEGDRATRSRTNMSGLPGWRGG